MDRFIIEGGKRLSGEVCISGAKNAAVAILPAAIIAETECTIDNVPHIQDVNIVIDIMRSIGAKVEWTGPNRLALDTSTVNSCDVTHEEARYMRGSYYFLGALLSRFGRASVAMPGGCNIGSRPIDQHTQMFAALGCDVAIDHGVVRVTGSNLHGAHVFFDKVSVGATINAMLSAVTAEGMTELENVAKEPHIVDTANFLNTLGADIRGAGTDVIRIRGVKSFHGCDYSVVPDQIEAGTYMAAAVGTGGDVLVKCVTPKHLESITSRFSRAGADIIEFDDSIRISRSRPMLATNIKTLPHPGFPTDMQPIFASLMTLANGVSVITESIWDDRFRYADQLRIMGADIKVDGNVAVIEGVDKLSAATVKACDLRAGAAMVVAGLMASGTTVIEDIHHIERGYEDIAGKLSSMGARIRKES